MNEEEMKKTNTLQNSILLKKDSKGNYNWEIKVYFDDEDVAIEKITKIDKLMISVWRKEE